MHQSWKTRKPVRTQTISSVATTVLRSINLRNYGKQQMQLMSLAGYKN